MPPGHQRRQCTVTFTSATAGTVTGNADGFVTVGGVSLDAGHVRHREHPVRRRPSSCGPAVKHFVAGSIAWTKVDNGGPAAGWCDVLALQDGELHAAVGPVRQPPAARLLVRAGRRQHRSAGLHGKDSDPARRQVQGDRTFARPLRGTRDERTAGIHPGSEDGGRRADAWRADGVIDAVSPFVNSRPVLKITGFGYTNAPDGPAQPDGIFKGTVVYTVNLHNYGTAAAALSNSSLVDHQRHRQPHLRRHRDADDPADHGHDRRNATA